MQALSMIDTSSNALEAIAPAKSAESKSQQFDKVLNEQSKPEQAQPAEKRSQTAESKTTDATEKREMKQECKQECEQTAKAEQRQRPAEEPQVTQQDQQQELEQPQVEVAADAEPKLQQVVMDLMKAIAGTEMSEDGEALENADSIEDLLNQLVEQLEGTELEGEQVLAGVDLTALVEQLQTLNEEGGEEQLAQLAEQLGLQLEQQLEQQEQESLLENAELAATAVATADPQAAAPKLMENLAQARQILQQAIDSVAAQKTSEVPTEEVVAVDASDETNAQELLAGEKKGEEIDPRFASLLKPRNENRVQQQQGLRQQAQAEPVKQNAEAVVTEAAPTTVELKPEQTEVKDFVQQLGNSAKQQGLENLGQNNQGQVQSVAQQTQQVNAKVMPETPTIQLPSGQQVAESQVFDQVVARFSSSFSGEAKSVVLRMQPAELGSLKIELMVEGDRVRANLHAQSQQVQEVLERNLPQLRNALAEQGLKIDQFQVNVNQEQSQQQQFDQLAQQQQQRQGSQSQSQWQQPTESEEQIVPLAHLMQNGGGGISLHV